MQTWPQFDRVTTDLHRAATAFPKKVLSSECWEQWFLFLREDAQAFLAARDRKKARALERSLWTWKTKHQRESGSLQSPHTPPRRMSGDEMRAVQRLAEDVDQYLNERALQSVREESPKVLARFSTAMPAEYSAALTATFVGMGPLRHANLLLHESRTDFENHYNYNFRRPGMFPATGVLAFCTKVYPNYPQTDELSGRTAPENRVIELPPDFESNSVAHELLHWATHQHYEDASGAYDGPANKVIIEGVTEYFSRVIHQARTNYAWELEIVQRAITLRRVTDNSLRAAYFGGTEVAKVADALAATAAQGSPGRDAEAFQWNMDNWARNLPRYLKKTRFVELSRPLQEFLVSLSDAEIDTLGQKANVDIEFVGRIKGWVATERLKVIPRA